MSSIQQMTKSFDLRAEIAIDQFLGLKESSDNLLVLAAKILERLGLLNCQKNRFVFLLSVSPNFVKL